MNNAAARYFSVLTGTPSAMIQTIETKRTQSASVRSLYTLILPANGVVGVPPFLLFHDGSFRVPDGLTARAAERMLLEKAMTYAEDVTVKRTLVFLPDGTDVPSSDCVCLTAESPYENRCSVALPPSPDTPAYGIVRDGAIVSAAVTNTPVLHDELREIGVYTAPDFRRRGYAASCVRTLAAAWQKRGILPIYRTSPDNLPSVKTARSAGFLHAATRISVLIRTEKAEKE